MRTKPNSLNHQRHPNHRVTDVELNRTIPLLVVLRPSIVENVGKWVISNVSVALENLSKNPKESRTISAKMMMILSWHL